MADDSTREDGNSLPNIPDSSALLDASSDLLFAVFHLSRPCVAWRFLGVDVKENSVGTYAGESFSSLFTPPTKWSLQIAASDGGLKSFLLMALSLNPFFPRLPEYDRTLNLFFCSLWCLCCYNRTRSKIGPSSLAIKQKTFSVPIP